MHALNMLVVVLGLIETIRSERLGRTEPGR